MTPDEVGARAVALLAPDHANHGLAGDGADGGGGGGGGAEAGAPGAAVVRAEVAFGQVTVDVPVEAWAAAHLAVRDDPVLGCDFFDWLSAYERFPEDPGGPGFVLVSHLWSVEHRHSVLLRTSVGADRPHVPTVTGVFRGAGWHERETFEMFGVVFDDHPMLVPLLLPDGFVGHPLRKDFVLAARVAKQWPGGKDPDEPKGGAPSRRKVTPPGVPDPDEWAPDVPR